MLSHFLSPFRKIVKLHTSNIFHNLQSKISIFKISIAANLPSISIKKKLEIIKNSFFNKKVFSNLSALIEMEKPEIAYVLQYGSKLSTSIFDACKKYDIPVVVRVSDFNLICAKNVFFRNNEICTKCIYNKLYSLKYKCVHDSFAQSFIYYLSQKYNQLRTFEKKIDAFIAPSKFTINLLKSNNQFSSSRFFHVPTFIEDSKYEFNLNLRDYNLQNGLKICYWGRIDEDKGIDILIDAVKLVSQNGFKLGVKIVGDTNSEYAQNQIRRTKDFGLDNISFLGYVSNQNIFEEIRDCHFSVIPSKWFDNMPNSLIESCTFGIPVIVSKIGSLDEIISDGKNGFTFNPSDTLDLANKIENLFNLRENNYNNISAYCQKWIKDYCDKNSHYRNLMNVFNMVIDEKDSK